MSLDFPEITGGEKLKRKTAYYPGPFGVFAIETEEGVVTRLMVLKNDPETDGERTALSGEVMRQLKEYFEGTRRTFTVPVALSGTVFQKKVWGALLKIPYGSTLTYGELAKRTGSPGAARAIGSACGKNPLWILVPCHRVIGSKGNLAGYAGGLFMKEALLKLEEENMEK